MTRNQTKSVDYSRLLKEKKFIKSPLAALLQKDYFHDIETIKRLYAIAQDSFLERSGKKKYFKKPALISKGSWYIGEVSEDNIPDGIGYMLNSDGSYYEGKFLLGKPNGYGQLLSQKGFVCSGEWKSGEIDFGTLRFENHKFYIGQIKDFQAHGEGKEESPEYVYQGTFLSGLKHGNGQVMWVDDNWYEGQFFKGKIEGIGKHVWEDKLYEGEWKANKMHGKGVLTWDDGRKYEGSMINGIREGYGTMWEDGREYTGYWKDGKEDGKGKLRVNGLVVKGIWHKGKIVRKFSEYKEEEKVGIVEVKIHEKYRRRYAKIVKFREEIEGLANSDPLPIDFFAGLWVKLSKGVYKGERDESGRPNGKGILVSSNKLYEGDFIMGKKSGFGRLLSNCEDVYSGGWLNNKRSGYGTLKTKDTKYEGEWKNDFIDGEGKMTTSSYIYNGSWLESETNGFGVIEYYDGNSYTGEFHRGTITGIGIFRYSNGNSIKALWKDGIAEEVLESSTVDSSNGNGLETVRSLNCIRFKEIYV